jgi:hypothetical protein
MGIGSRFKKGIKDIGMILAAGAVIGTSTPAFSEDNKEILDKLNESLRRYESLQERKGAISVRIFKDVDYNKDSVPDAVFEYYAGDGRWYQVPMYGKVEGSKITYVPAAEMKAKNQNSKTDYNRIEAEENNNLAKTYKNKEYEKYINLPARMISHEKKDYNQDGQPDIYYEYSDKNNKMHKVHLYGVEERVIGVMPFVDGSYTTVCYESKELILLAAIDRGLNRIKGFLNDIECIEEKLN